MGQIRHGCASTMHAIRATTQRSQASNAELSRELGTNVKTVAKWRKRQTVEDKKTGPKEPSLTVLSKDEEAMIVVFRRHTLLPLDDCLYAPQPSTPHLTRSSSPRCLQRHGISRLPDMDVDNLPEDAKDHELLEFDDKVAEAVARLKRAQQDFPGEAEFPSAEGQLWQQLGESEKASSAFQKAISIRPRNTGAFARLSRIQKAGGSQQQAASTLEKALERFPQDKTFIYRWRF